MLPRQCSVWDGSGVSVAGTEGILLRQVRSCHGLKWCWFAGTIARRAHRRKPGPEPCRRLVAYDEPVADELLSPAEVARVLYIPEWLVHSLIVEGKLPAMRSPVRVLRSDLDQCLEACRIKPGDLANRISTAHRNITAGRR